MTRLIDVVAETFAAAGVGSLHDLADGPVTVASRTGTSASSGGGCGQTIPGSPVERASVTGSGQSGTLRMVVDHTAGCRSNLGIVNVSSAAVTVAVELLTADGQPAGGDGVIIRVGVVSDDGAVLAYLSTVDNATNDASPARPASGARARAW